MSITGPRRPTVISQLFPEDKSDDLLTGNFPEDMSSEEDYNPNTQKVCVCNEASTPIEISSDEELEKSMVEMERQISLEMTDSD